MKLSLEEVKVSRELLFAGFIPGQHGVKPDPAKIAFLCQFPSPTSFSEFGSFVGLASQLGSFFPDLANYSTEICSLLKYANPFVWLPIHEEEFHRAENISVLCPFDPSPHVELLKNASRLHGLGYILLQWGANGEPLVIQCGPSSLASAQCNYATIELEASFNSWAAEKCDYYL
eukprot:TCALIF_12936-PA protein Name:"Similar to pol Retrovirus-related Pol polyprotein from transposon 297 (Drosophila melanogaster)" AED:0.26 eAED:0.26 QI:0/-1/0/1/-1/1/1/0/173